MSTENLRKLQIIWALKVVYIRVSVSLESSVMGHDEMLQVLKEKMRLEGQLESLSSEANQVMISVTCLL